MSSTVLYRKWRPQTLSEVVGQEHVTRTLLNALATGRVSHAYLFCGPRGTGKTSTARILAKALNCLTNGKGEPCGSCTMCRDITDGRALDLIEIDAASNRGIDDIRELRDKISFAPNEARYKVYIVDEVHMLTDFAFNALLKTLEEPPPHAIFVLATTEVHQVPATILSRCQRFDFRRIPQQSLVDHLKHICDTEGIEAETPALELLVRSAGGSARDAVNLLEQAEVSHGGRVSLDNAQQMLGITEDARAMEILRAIVQSDLHQGMAAIQAVREDGVGLPQFGKEVASLLRALLLVKSGAADTVDVSAERMAELRNFAQTVNLSTVQKALLAFSQADFRSDPGSSLPLELALVDTVLSAQTQSEERPPNQPIASAPRERTPASSAPPREPAPAYRPSRPAASLAAPATPAPMPRIERPVPSLAAPAVAADTPSPTAAQKSIAADGSELEQIRQVIREVKVPQIKFVESLLHSNGCQVENVDGVTIILGFKPNLAIHKDRVEKPENLRFVEQALKELTGKDYRIRCVITNGERPASQQAEPGHLVQAALNAGARRISHEPQEAQ